MAVGQIPGAGDHPMEDAHSCQDVAFCGLGDDVVVPYLKENLLEDNQIGEGKVVAQRDGEEESHPA